MLRLSWTDYVRNEDVLNKIGTKNKLQLTIRNIQLKSERHNEREREKKKLRELDTHRDIEGEKGKNSNEFNQGIWINEWQDNDHT